MYGASLHQQEPDVAVAVGKDGYLKVLVFVFVMFMIYDRYKKKLKGFAIVSLIITGDIFCRCSTWRADGS